MRISDSREQVQYVLVRVRISAEPVENALDLRRADVADFDELAALRGVSSVAPGEEVVLPVDAFGLVLEVQLTAGCADGLSAFGFRRIAVPEHPDLDVGVAVGLAARRASAEEDRVDGRVGGKGVCQRLRDLVAPGCSLRHAVSLKCPTYSTTALIESVPAPRQQLPRHHSNDWQSQSWNASVRQVSLGVQYAGADPS